MYFVLYDMVLVKMKYFKILFTLYLIVTTTSAKSEHKRSLIFPPTSLYGTFLAIAVPIDIPNKNVFVSYNFESNYSTLNNITEIDEALFPNLPLHEPPSQWMRKAENLVLGRHLGEAYIQQWTADVTSRQSRSISRELTYTVLENRFQEYGMKGRECMLRNICEAAETPLHHDGILGHIMHIIFTPSSSKEEGLEDEYYEAEADGHRGDCDKYIDLCPTSLFDYITRLVQLPHPQ